MSSSLKKKILIAAIALLAAAPVIAYIAIGRDARGFIRYYAWKAVSSRAGTGHRIPINDITLYYEIHGTGKPLLLMHGGLVFIETFYNQIPVLARKYMVIAPDSRAHGRTTDSSKPLGYHLMAEDMAALLKHLKVKKASIVGWSDGGIIGLDLAMNHPDLVERLVVIGANFNTGAMTAESNEMVKKMNPDTLEIKPVHDFYARIAPDPQHWPAFVDKIRTLWLTQPNYTAADLKKIKAPTLIILGENDSIRKDHGEEMERSIPGSKLLIIRGASHFVGMEKPDELNKAIIDFLK